MTRAGLLLLGVAVGACAAPVCKDNTVLVTVSLAGGTARADTFDVTVTVNASATLHALALPHTPGAATGTLELDFPHGYPAQQTLRVTIEALSGRVSIGSGSGSAYLSGNCATLPITVQALSVSDMAVVATDDLQATPDLSPLFDLARTAYDLTLPVFDLAGQSCGTVGAACCTGGVCNGSRCTNSVCMSDCGGPDQPCCQMSYCSSGFICINGTCTLCGELNYPCCANNGCGNIANCCDNGMCITDGKLCSNGSLCVNGACGSCGKAGAACCAGTCTAQQTTCSGGSCVGCGLSGQPCCSGAHSVFALSPSPKHTSYSASTTNSCFNGSRSGSAPRQSPPTRQGRRRRTRRRSIARRHD
jgi:hypothetical protein